MKIPRYNTDYFTPASFGKKLEKIINYHYSTLKPHQRRNQFVIDYQTMFDDDISRNVVDQWFNMSRIPKNITRLMNICNLLDCDIDYFLTSQEDFKLEYNYESSRLGISQDNVSKIFSMPTEEKNLLGFLIEKDYIHTFCGYLQAYFYNLGKKTDVKGADDTFKKNIADHILSDNFAKTGEQILQDNKIYKYFSSKELLEEFKNPQSKDTQKELKESFETIKKW